MSGASGSMQLHRTESRVSRMACGVLSQAAGWAGSAARQQHCFMQLLALALEGQAPRMEALQWVCAWSDHASDTFEVDCACELELRLPFPQS